MTGEIAQIGTAPDRTRTEGSRAGMETRERAFREPLNRAARAEIERVAHNIFFSRPGEAREAVLFGGTEDGSRSSEWVVVHIGQFLANRGRQVRVLCLTPELPSGAQARLSDGRSSTILLSERCTVEWLSLLGADADIMPGVADRLLDSRKRGESVLVHIENLNRAPELLSVADQLDGVALIVRAARTRKAALAALREHLAAAEVPILGGILIDQDFPIPERLYRVL